MIDHGRVIAGGTAAELKAQIGGARLEVTLQRAPTRRRLRALEPFVAGPCTSATTGAACARRWRRRPGLATTVVRALDEAGVTVDDVEVHQPSLDDVFFALTGPTQDRRDHTDQPDSRSAA